MTLITHQEAPVVEEWITAILMQLPILEEEEQAAHILMELILGQFAQEAMTMVQTQEAVHQDIIILRIMPVEELVFLQTVM